MSDTMLTPREVSSILKVSYETALAFIKYSGVDYIKVDRQYRVSEAKLSRFLAQKGQICIDTAENL